MSYKIGQFRKQHLTSTSVSNIQTDIRDILTRLNNAEFYDKDCVVSEPLVEGKCYYLKFSLRLKSVGESATRTISLSLSDSSYSKTQTLSSSSVSIGMDNDVVIETMIYPNLGFDHILIKINRIAADYKIINEQLKAGSLIDNLQIISLYELPNVLTLISGAPSYLTKIGIQAPSSFLMNINGEEIRVGKTGIYEINNGIKIKSIYFLPTQQDYFIMDYEY